MANWQITAPSNNHREAFSQPPANNQAPYPASSSSISLTSDLLTSATKQKEKPTFLNTQPPWPCTAHGRHVITLVEFKFELDAPPQHSQYIRPEWTVTFSGITLCENLFQMCTEHLAWLFYIISNTDIWLHGHYYHLWIIILKVKLRAWTRPLECKPSSFWCQSPWHFNEFATDYIEIHV